MRVRHNLSSMQLMADWVLSLALPLIENLTHIVMMMILVMV